jgi:hypothetical protein
LVIEMDYLLPAFIMRQHGMCVPTQPMLEETCDKVRPVSRRFPALGHLREGFDMV